MSATNQPFGLRPVGHLYGGDVRPTQIDGFISSGYAANIGFGTPIKINQTNGVIAAASTAEDICGVFAGCIYRKTGDSLTTTGHWPTGTTYVAGTMSVSAYMDPATIYEVQANGSLAQTSIGQQADFNNPGTIDTATGYSQARISTTLVATGNPGQLRILELSDRLDNAWGDAFTVVKVQIARHQYVANKNTLA